jgi:GT2 family glycosyltransferase
MKLSVVILNWNAAQDTARSIRSVMSWHSYSDLPRPTIWVVDNGSRELDLESLKEQFGDVRFLSSPVNLGFAGGSNLGITAARDFASDAILLLNNDASVDQTSMGCMLDTLDSDAGIGVVGPSLWYGERLLSVGGRDIAYHADTHITPSQLPESLLEVDYVPGTVALISKKVFDEVGLLDEDYFFGGEMADLCRRARQLGFRCVTVPKAQAFHDLDRSSEIRESLHVYYVFRNRFLYIRKHYPQHRARLYTLWTLRGAYAVIKAVAKGHRRRARAISLSLIDGWAGQFGGQNERVLS